MTGMTPQLCIGCADQLGEAALWHPVTGHLFWIDLLQPRLHRLHLASNRHHTTPLDLVTPLGAIVATTDPGVLLVSHRHGLSLLEIASGATRPFADPEAGRDAISYNDAKVDRQGRLWAGTSHLPEVEPRGALWRVDGEGRAVLCDAGYVVFNGPAFSPDGRLMYASDTFARVVHVYDLDPAEPMPRNRRLFARLAEDEGYPDGLTVDSEGALWVAHWNGGRLTRFGPDGSRLLTVPVPAPNVTSIAFAGGDLRTAYVTTARDGLSAETLARFPLSGALFCFRAAVPGLAEPLFTLEV
jgi:xylono-1,5-lactonase